MHPAFSSPFTLQLHFEGGSHETINVGMPVHGHAFIGNWTKAKTDAQGTLKLTLPIETKGVCQVYFFFGEQQGRYNCIQLFVEPGGNYTIRGQRNDLWNTLQFEGDLAKEQALLNSFEQQNFEVSGAPLFIAELLKNSNALEAYDQIQQQKEADLARINAMEDLHDDFASFLRNDITYYYGMVAIMTWMHGRQPAVTTPLVYNDESDLWDKQLTLHFTHVAIENRKALPSMWYAMFKSFYLRIQTVMNAENSAIDFWSVVKGQFKGEVAEHTLAYFINGMLLKNKFAPEALEQYKKFEAAYPNSSYLPLLTANIADVLAFREQEKQQANSSKGIYFIESKALDQVSGLASHYPNRFIYVDVWATWCGPCRKEFENTTPEFDALLQQYKVQKVYITVDQPEKREQWREMVDYYQLKGGHVFAGELLQEDLRAKAGGRLLLPTYMIIDDSGKVVEHNAARPSQLKLLKQQFKKHIK